MAELPKVGQRLELVIEGTLYLVEVQEVLPNENDSTEAELRVRPIKPLLLEEEEE